MTRLLLTRRARLFGVDVVVVHEPVAPHDSGVLLTTSENETDLDGAWALDSEPTLTHMELGDAVALARTHGRVALNDDEWVAAP